MGQRKEFGVQLGFQWNKIVQNFKQKNVFFLLLFFLKRKPGFLVSSGFGIKVVLASQNELGSL